MKPPKPGSVWDPATNEWSTPTREEQIEHLFFNARNDLESSVFMVFNTLLTARIATRGEFEEIGDVAKKTFDEAMSAVLTGYQHYESYRRSTLCAVAKSLAKKRAADDFDPSSL